MKHLKSAVARPANELHGFRRVSRPNETKTVEIPLAADSLRYWDIAGKHWTLEPDDILLTVGESSAGALLSHTLHIGGSK